MPFLIVILTWFARYLVLKALAVLGVGIASYAIVQYFFDKYVNAGLSQIGGISADLSNMMALAHIDHAISIVLGAYAVKAFMIAMKSVFTKLGVA